MKNFIRTIQLIEKQTQPFVYLENGILKSSMDYSNNLINRIINMRKFVIDDYEALMLSKTKTNLELVNMPFDEMYIDLDLQLGDINIMGLEILKISPKNHFNNIEDIYVAGYYINTKTRWFGGFECSVLCDEIIGLNTQNQIILKPNQNDEMTKELSENNIKQVKFLLENMKYFAVNLLKYITDPEIEIITIDNNKERNQKRIDRGQIPITHFNYIRLTGVLKKYLNYFKEMPLSQLQHSVWVRGHWRTFTANRYKNMRNKKIWILPFIRGTGELIDKIYQVRKEYLDRFRG